jgi:hypothetical protein
MEMEQTDDVHTEELHLTEVPLATEYEELTRGFNYKELHELRHHITCRMTEMRNSGITQLRATIAEQATILGVDIADLVPKKQRRKRRTKAEMSEAAE